MFYDYCRNNKKILEKKLVLLIKDMCVVTQIGFSDWDIGKGLAEAISTAPNAKKINAVSESYNALYVSAKDLGVKLDTKFKPFYEFLVNKTQ